MNDLHTPAVKTNLYRSYLVRIWQSHEAGGWRASAQCVQTGHKLLFGELSDLLAFLRDQAEDPNATVTLSSPSSDHPPASASQP